MFTLTLACFAILIFRCSDQANMVIGSPLANRRPETEPLIGPFAGPIPFRFDLSNNPTLRDVIKRVSEVSLEALDHSDLPFEALLSSFACSRSTGARRSSNSISFIKRPSCSPICCRGWR